MRNIFTKSPRNMVAWPASSQRRRLPMAQPVLPRLFCDPRLPDHWQEQSRAALPVGPRVSALAAG